MAEKNKKRKNPPLKKWIVNIDKKVSNDILVEARTPSQARKIAWERYKKKAPKRKEYELLVDENYYRKV